MVTDLEELVLADMMYERFVKGKDFGIKETRTISHSARVVQIP